MKVRVEGDIPATERAKDIARWVLSGAYDPLLACRDLAGLRTELPGVADEIIDIFVGVASEIDDLPIGSERERWSADALKAKDAEAGDYRERVREVVEEAFRRLLTAVGGRH